MFMTLPTHGFKWIMDSDFNIWKSMSCILEVDLEYSKELHKLHNESSTCTRIN